MLPKIYVDGQEGTTGLKIHEHLAQRQDVETLRIDPEKRKNPAERRKLLNAADLVFLCLPDAASREAVALIDNPKTKVIDASTAFRTDPAWAYGLPELSSAHRQKIKTATRIANPGCHASAFLLAVAPLVAAGIVRREALLTCYSLTGYSGGGKKMIAAYQAPDRPAALSAPRPYALKLAHKHLPEMQHLAGLAQPPLFTPVVCDIYIGLCVTTFLPPAALAAPAAPAEIREHLAGHYVGEKFIQVLPFDPEAAFDNGAFDITACNNTNRADLAVVGHDDQIALLCRLDNLGKGASGAAIQSMNLALNFQEDASL
jgi:N-acetyl-gamma-glutamyl-phosphate reductase